MRTTDRFNLDLDKLRLSHLPKRDKIKLIIPNEFIDYDTGTVHLDKIAHWLYEAGVKYESDVIIEYETR